MASIGAEAFRMSKNLRGPNSQVPLCHRLLVEAVGLIGSLETEKYIIIKSNFSGLSDCQQVSAIVIVGINKLCLMLFIEGQFPESLAPKTCA